MMAAKKLKKGKTLEETGESEVSSKTQKKAKRGKKTKTPAKKTSSSVATKKPKKSPGKKKIDELLEEIAEEEESGEENEDTGESFDEKPAWKNEKKVYHGELAESKVYVWDEQEAEEVYDLGCFGKIRDDKKNELSLEEALLLMKRNKLIIKKDGEELNEKAFFNHACSQDAEFSWKFSVYEELRGRGLLVRTGFKFGTHFRVYARGVKLKRGPKSVKEHTKWIVHAVPENYTCSFPELSRAVRLAHNIRAKMLWAVVDEEGDVTYYEVLRKTP